MVIWCIAKSSPYTTWYKLYSIWVKLNSNCLYFSLNKMCFVKRKNERSKDCLPDFSSIKRTTFGPSLTTPKSSVIRGDRRVLHAPTSSLLNFFRAICVKTIWRHRIESYMSVFKIRQWGQIFWQKKVVHLLGCKSVSCVDILSTVNLTVGTFFDKMWEDVLPPLFIFKVHRLDFL